MAPGDPAVSPTPQPPRMRNIIQKKWMVTTASANKQYGKGYLRIPFAPGYIDRTAKDGWDFGLSHVQDDRAPPPLCDAGYRKPEHGDRFDVSMELVPSDLDFFTLQLRLQGVSPVTPGLRYL